MADQVQRVDQAHECGNERPSSMSAERGDCRCNLDKTIGSIGSERLDHASRLNHTQCAPNETIGNRSSERLDRGRMEQNATETSDCREI